ncbi:MAG: hypothetical protein JWN27_1962 [Candidatus Eremiobacteraeota bacterium]|nr:hypothetical protein [Candidatus Eremiobacteraeota bacterium]
MTDRFDPVVRGLVGVGIVACVVTAAAIRPAALPPEARSAWLPAASQVAVDVPSSTHGKGHTFALDVVTIGARTLPYQDQPYAVERGTLLQIRGWAFDPALRRTADHVAARVDAGAWKYATYHVARPDVAAALSVPHAADCGFLVTVPTGGLAPGQHTIEIATVTGATRIPLTDAVRLFLSAR